jgi:hypothetical protein
MQDVLFSFDNDSIYPRQDEIWASQMWATIVREIDKKVTSGELPEARIRLEDASRMQEDATLLHVIMEGDSRGIYWNGEFVDDDLEILDVTAALLCLRGQVERVYLTEERYEEAVSKANEEADEDCLGDLDDHPF